MGAAAPQRHARAPPKPPRPATAAAPAREDHRRVVRRALLPRHGAREDAPEDKVPPKLHLHGQLLEVVPPLRLLRPDDRRQLDERRERARAGVEAEGEERLGRAALRLAEGPHQALRRRVPVVRGHEVLRTRRTADPGEARR